MSGKAADRTCSGDRDHAGDIGTVRCVDMQLDLAIERRLIDLLVGECHGAVLEARDRAVLLELRRVEVDEDAVAESSAVRVRKAERHIGDAAGRTDDPEDMRRTAASGGRAVFQASSRLAKVSDADGYAVRRDQVHLMPAHILLGLVEQFRIVDYHLPIGQLKDLRVGERLRGPRGQRRQEIPAGKAPELVELPADEIVTIAFPYDREGAILQPDHLRPEIGEEVGEGNFVSPFRRCRSHGIVSTKGLTWVLRERVARDLESPRIGRPKTGGMNDGCFALVSCGMRLAVTCFRRELPGRGETAL